MALSYQSFITAKDILEDVAKVGESFLPGYVAETEQDIWKTNRLIWEGEKSDGGKESVWTVIENPTNEQIEIFERRKGEINNSPIFKSKDNLVMFGWY